MKKIKKLTKEQEAKIPLYLEEGLKKGLSTERLSLKDTQKSIYWLYSTFLSKYRKPYIFTVESPLQATYAAVILDNSFKSLKADTTQLDSQLNSPLNSQLDSQLYSQLDSQLRSQLESQLYSQLYSQLDHPVSHQLDSQLNSQLGFHLDFQLDSQLGSQLESQLQHQLHSQLSSQLNSQLSSQLYSQLGSQLDSQPRPYLDPQHYHQLYSILESQFNRQLRSQLYSQLDHSVNSQLNSQLYSQLDSQLYSQLGSQLRTQLELDPHLLDSQLNSQLKYRISFRYWWTGYYKFYEYVQKELLPEVKINGLEEMVELCYNIPFVYIYDGFCVVSQPPVEINRKGTVLHNESRKAVAFSDGWGLCALNGILMPEKYVTTEAKDISVSDVMKEENVDIRREVLRKIGLERFIKETNGKCLDKLVVEVNNKKCEYQLLEVDFGEGVVARVLKMDNPSIDAMHVEGVEDTCNTVKEALAWRNGFSKYTEPEQLT